MYRFFFKFIRQFFLFFAALLFISCAISSPQNPLHTLAPPLGLKANGSDGSILLSFYAANDEGDFDGFNVYISESENVADTVDGRQPLIPEGIAPTIRMNFTDIDTNKAIEYRVVFRDNTGTPLASGTEYFFIVRSHSSNNYVSEPSNEASALIP